MDEEDDGGASTPFWLQSRRTSSLGGRVTTVITQIFFAGAAAILIVFFIIPQYSSVSQIFRPNLVRKSWDYLNFVLVLFAVICGFLSSNIDNDEINREDRHKFSRSPSIIDRGRVSNGATPRYWMDDRGGDQMVYKRFSRLRSSSSYPDLRLREFEADERWRFYDDTNVSECRYEASDRIFSNQDYSVRQEVKSPEDVDQTYGGSDGRGEGKSFTSGSDADKVEVFAEVEEELAAPSLSPPRAPTSKLAKRVYQDVALKEEKKERADFAEATPPMTLIPSLTTVYQKSNKQEKKKGDFLIALRRKKKKKQQQQSIDGLDLLFGFDSLSDYSIPQKSPPHPPPPPKSRSSMAKIHKAPVESHTSKPNPPAKVLQFTDTGSESPLLPIPPPPPPPPFKMPAWKFVKRGDYVRMASNISISSDDLDDSDVTQSPDSNATGSPFCPSPDVDTKADDFIARFRAGLKLEKMNSVKRGRSNLGPDPGSNEFGS